MGLLDDLKKEATVVKAQQAQAQSSTTAQKDLIKQSIGQKIAELYKYFNELKEQLTVVDPDIYRDYDVQGFGKLTRLRQGKYRCFSDTTDEVTRFTFGFTCEKDGRVEFKKDSPAMIQQQREYLRDNGFKFKNRDSSNGS